MDGCNFRFKNMTPVAPLGANILISQSTHIDVHAEGII